MAKKEIPTEQVAFAGATIIPEAGKIHQPVVLMLDASESMGWDQGGNALPIDELNAGVKAFLQSWKNDEVGEIVDVAIVVFNDEPTLIQGFQSAANLPDFSPIQAAGTTYMGAALNFALDVVDEYKARLHASGTEYHRPWIVCLTDGEPTDKDGVMAVTQRLKEAEANRGVVGYCVGVDGFNAMRVAEIFQPENILLLKNYNFNELFEFLHNSLVAASQPDGGSEVRVELPQDIEPYTFTVHR